LYFTATAYTVRDSLSVAMKMKTQLTYSLRSEREEKAIRSRIVAAYTDWVINLYCKIRFVIINLRILNELEQYLPQQGIILDIGCGFGLFSHYFLLTGTNRRMLSFDLQPRRIMLANKAAATLGTAERATFLTQNALEYPFEQPVDAIVTLDLLHHLPAARVPQIIECCFRNLKSGGILLVKDIETRSWFKVFFTWLLDKFMSPNSPVCYYSRVQMTTLLSQAGFDVKSHQMLDILPYPHILYVCRKSDS
jgi:2-polyprenyl-3-methyl-5-hydroxy-6-metoxy-1,4-benzoquinol methylase